MDKKISYVPVGWEAQVHRETAIAVLKGQLRRPGAKKAFAAEIGISPQYLSYLLDPYDHRTPSPRIAHAIVRALALTEHERGHMLEHLMMAGQRDPHALPFVAPGHAHDDSHLPIGGDDEVEAWVQHVQHLFARSLSAHDPKVGRGQMTTAAQTARHFLHTLDPWQYPLAYAEVALVLHEINSIRNQLSRAIHYAKRARMILSYADERILRPQQSRAMNALTNALRSEAAECTNLGLHKAALDLLNQAEASPGAITTPALWLPHLHRDRLNAMRGLRRVAIVEAERVTHQGIDWTARAGGPDAEILAVLLERGLAGVYLRQGRPAQAERILLQLMVQLAQMPRVGPFYHVLVHMDYAEMLWRAQRLDEWRHTMVATIQLAAEAELTQVLARIRNFYGRAAEPLLANLDSALAPSVFATKGGGD